MFARRLVLDLLFMLVVCVMYAAFLVLLGLLWFHHFCVGLTRLTRRLGGAASKYGTFV
jgi:hypothetical protein